MIGFIVRRALWAVVLLVAVTMVTFDLFFLIPAQPGTTGARRAQNTTNIPESLDIRGPVYKQYGTFVWRIGHGSFCDGPIGDPRRACFYGRFPGN